MSDKFDTGDGVEEEYLGVTQQTNAIVTPAVEEPIPELDVLDMDSVLKHTQNIRLKAIRKINTALAQEVSSDMISVLLKTASDMDKAVVSRKRVGIEEEAAKTSEQMQRDTAGILRAINAKMFKVDPQDIDPNRVPPQLDDANSQIEPVPGETEIGAPNLSYDAFAKGQQAS